MLLTTTMPITAQPDTVCGEGDDGGGEGAEQV